MEVSDILRRFREMAGSPRCMIAVSVSAPWPRTAVVACGGGVDDDESLLLDIPASFPRIDPHARPRVSFSIGPDNNGSEIRGSGIAHREESGTNRFRLKPYRISCNVSAQRGNAAVEIERRQNAWRFRHQEHAVGGRGRTSPAFWFRAARGISFPLSVFPILIGTSCALLKGPVDWVLFTLALIGGVAAHAATNLFSDYSDYVKGVDTTNALSSHTGVLADELVEPNLILMASCACGLVTAFAGGVLVMAVGWPILIFGISGILGGFFYTGGPRAFKYAGFGEVSTGFLMGPLMMCGAYFVQTRTLSVPVILMSVSVGLLVSAVSYANNVRDAFFDREAGITSMPVRLGPRGAVAAFRVILILPYLLVGSAVFLDMRLAPVLAVLAAAPWSILDALRFGRRPKGAPVDLKELSSQAGQSILALKMIKRHTAFCFLMLVGCAVACIVNGRP